MRTAFSRSRISLVLLKRGHFRHAATHDYETGEALSSRLVWRLGLLWRQFLTVSPLLPLVPIYSFGTAQPIDGGVPKGSLTYVNGLLFGRTTTTIATMPTPASTPVGSYGVIFHFDPTNVASSYSIDHVFAGHDTDDGDNPRHDAMTPFNNQLYGTTLDGGTHNNGIIFSIGQDGTGYQVLLSLHNSIGDESHSCFVVANNILYGMTASGGDNGEGVIFSFNPATPTPTPTATPTPTPANFQTLFSFACASSTGKEPHGRLTLDPNGTTLYGMTRKGGEHDFGVVFKVDTSGGNLPGPARLCWWRYRRRDKRSWLRSAVGGPSLRYDN